MVKPNLTVIEILWEGPLKIEDAKKKTDKDTDYGLYQVYGTHNIYGANTLLYIGKASEQELGNRILQHDSWTSIEQSELTIYFGFPVKRGQLFGQSLVKQRDVSR